MNKTSTLWIRKRSKIQGWGIFAATDIKKNTKIIQYVGEKITIKESWRREELRLQLKKRGGVGHVFTFQLNKRYEIDGNVPYNHARHINHSCEPNAEALQEGNEIWIVAKKNIMKGEEITYDYGFPFATWRDHPCLCGTSSCVGYIVQKSQRWRVRKIHQKNLVKNNKI